MRCPLVATGDDDGRHFHSRIRYCAQNIQAAQARHMEVEQEAIGSADFQHIDELLSGSERYHIELRLRDKSSDSLANRRIIVDDSNQGPFVGQRHPMVLSKYSPHLN